MQCKFCSKDISQSMNKGNLISAFNCSNCECLFYRNEATNTIYQYLIYLFKENVYNYTVFISVYQNHTKIYKGSHTLCDFDYVVDLTPSNALEKIRKLELLK